MQLLTGLNSLGSTSLETVEGQEYSIYLAGAFDGATCTLQYLVGSATGDFANGAFTAAGGVSFRASGRDQITISATGASTSVNAKVVLDRPARGI